MRDSSDKALSLSSPIASSQVKHNVKNSFLSLLIVFAVTDSRSYFIPETHVGEPMLVCNSEKWEATGVSHVSPQCPCEALACSGMMGRGTCGRFVLDEPGKVDPCDGNESTPCCEDTVR